VLDGDSLRLICARGSVEVRLHCIDAPEKDQRPWSDRARDHLREMAARELELVRIETDRFGRTVGEVYTSGPERRFLNLEQVRSGHAAVYDRYCEDARFARAEREARAARLGIWSRKGLHQTPWVFRQRR
jgi:endonuclease YncB( thermonuclease family)